MKIAVGNGLFGAPEAELWPNLSMTPEVINLVILPTLRADQVDDWVSE